MSNLAVTKELDKIYIAVRIGYNSRVLFNERDGMRYIQSFLRGVPYDSYGDNGIKLAKTTELPVMEVSRFTKSGMEKQLLDQMLGIDDQDKDFIPF